ncbi:hypothetical protein R7D97_16570 [Vibrio sp. Vb5031]|uniref:Uncharacterized protein n=4 Tax=Vibrio TaxID=662 RepID=A0A1B1LRI7_VIBPH|nr:MULTISPECIES: hypothetical protein [Vibrio]ANS55666.1 hypothetical protein [Vibrio parahaemolyticus]EJL6460737.1 hypothetical protein [Vibrio cholerae]EJL6490417.1 hypothetical protein [Vibrio cholerae]EJL6642108.1 hypothetical protein [Vibrio cholerae]KOO06923.1 hypothetical protein AKJ31_14580 [Vibrio hepatarius]
MSNTATPELKWQFKLGNTLIDFPNPFGSIQDNKRLLAQHFPQLRWTEIYEEDARLENGCMVLPVVPPPVKTNG